MHAILFIRRDVSSVATSESTENGRTGGKRENQRHIRGKKHWWKNLEES
jgi:hypothetical protein